MTGRQPAPDFRTWFLMLANESNVSDSFNAVSRSPLPISTLKARCANLVSLPQSAKSRPTHSVQQTQAPCLAEPLYKQKPQEGSEKYAESATFMAALCSFWSPNLDLRLRTQVRRCRHSFRVVCHMQKAPLWYCRKWRKLCSTRECCSHVCTTCMKNSPCKISSSWVSSPYLNVGSLLVQTHWCFGRQAPRSSRGSRQSPSS